MCADEESRYPFCPVEWNGYKGWASSSGLELPTTAPSPQPPTSTKRIKNNVSLGYLNLRTGPSLNQSVIARIPAGTNGVVVTGPCVQAIDENYPFCPVEWNGYKGWASSSGLE